MIRVHGVAIETAAARRLVARLIADGGADALVIASKLALNVARGHASVQLAGVECEIVLSVLVDPTDGLDELRSALLAERT